MDSVVPGGAGPLSEDTGILTVIDEYDGVFQNLYDVPFVLVNRVGDEIHAEIVVTNVDDEIDQDRMMTAHSVAAKLGFRSFARVFGDLYEDDNVVQYKYTDDPAKGLIWGLESELGDVWLS